MPSTVESRISTSPTITVLLRFRRRDFRNDYEEILHALSGRTVHLHQGRTRHVARPLGVGLTQVPDEQPQPKSETDEPGYVDIFYSHRYDPDTPLEETLQALVDIVRQGKALYVGISKYPKEAAEFAYKYLEERDVHCLLYQGRYNLFNREPEEEGILQQAKGNGTGFIAFSPLAQGLLTNRYLNGIPEDSLCMAKGLS